MPYPSVHKINVVHKNSHCASIGTTPAVAYLKIPFRCKIETVDVVAYGAITTADCSIAVALNGAAISGSPFILPVAGAGAGEIAVMIPPSPVYASDGDLLSFSPSGASGATIAGTFSAALKAM